MLCGMIHATGYASERGNVSYMANDNDAIRFSAQVSKVTTLSDGGLRVVLDMAENEIEVAKSLMEAKRAGAILEIAAVAIRSGGEWQTNER